MSEKFEAFKLTSEYISTDLTEITYRLDNILSNAICTDKFEISEFRIIKYKGSEFKENMTIQDLCASGVGLFDYHIYYNLEKRLQDMIKIEETEDDIRYKETEFVQSILSCYYIHMIRAKPFPEDQTELLPSFITNVMRVSLSVKDMSRILTCNDIHKISGSWVRYIREEQLPVLMVKRLKSGISGMRLITAFCSRELDKNTDPVVGRCQVILRKLIEDGPKLEFHSYFRPSSLSNISLNANMNNLLFNGFTQATLKQMRDQKLIYTIPTFDNQTKDWRLWTNATFSEFKTNLFN